MEKENYYTSIWQKIGDFFIGTLISILTYLGTSYFENNIVFIISSILLLISSIIIIRKTNRKYIGIGSLITGILVPLIVIIGAFVIFMLIFGACRIILNK